MSNIEFLEDGHIYLVDGVITPSVTQIVRSILGDSYANVPKPVLEAKAAYGEEMHEWIEKYMETGDASTDSLSPTQKLSVPYIMPILDGMRTKDLVVLTETPVAYFDKFAGKFDMMLLYRAQNHSVLIDIKTTVKYDPEYLSWQLSLYRLAIQNTLRISADELKCLWTPKKALPQLIDVEKKSWQECNDAVEAYREAM